MQDFQHDFIRNLNIYINGAIFSKFDLILSLVSSKLPFKRHAKWMIEEYHEFEKLATNINGSPIPYKKVQIKPYSGKNLYARAMIKYLKENLKEDLLGAYVHGSIATYEEIAYSDYDALVIVQNQTFSSQKRIADVAYKLFSTSEQMFKFDPLQHHGWFVLIESNLHCYPDYYFPVELFNYANSLFEDKGLELNIAALISNKKRREAFYSLSNKIIKRIQRHSYPGNIYQLKAFLSQFMLMPALYVHLRDGKGIFKKFSFEAAKKDFSEDLWSIMDDVSTLRQDWSYKLSSIKKRLFCKPRQIRGLLASKCAPGIPKVLKKTLTKKFYQRVMNLTIAMQDRIK